ncbi:MAG: 3-phosphoshikimate 1-carboxyvinyltransferase [Propionibacteriaceae bacterium]|nr:3-phosphoshikimate 1-carboxyvinyltransferase [Propionibacteriaceae bacterium]
MTSWQAPLATGPVDVSVPVPGSKSATARALVLSALAQGPGSVAGGLRARDTSLMIAGLRALGAHIDDSDATRWSIHPMGTPDTPVQIDAGLAGTVMRFLPPVAALGDRPVRFHGDPAASARPMAPLVQALVHLGATVDAASLPFAVTGPITGSEAQIDSSGSSQFVSGLLLAAARFPSGLRLTHRGGPIPSLPHIDMTCAALAARGVDVERDVDVWCVAPGPIDALDEVIEPDLTTAAVFLAIALVAGGSVTVPGWPTSTTQPGARITQILEQMGAVVVRHGDQMTVSGTGTWDGVDIDLHDTSELTPVVAALAALAGSPTTIRGVAHIRGHETDRLAALSSQITALGGDCRETPDGLVIRPRPLRGGVFHTFADHRMAHAGALIGARVPGVILDDVDCTSKTMPGFASVWERIVR